MVICNGFRNPALTAKMASTIDVISGGRFELGLGAGAFWEAIEAMGDKITSKKLAAEVSGPCELSIIEGFRLQDALDILIIATLLYQGYILLFGSRAWNVLRGLLGLAAIWFIAAQFGLELTRWLFDAVAPVRHPDAPAPGELLGAHYEHCFGCGEGQPHGLHLQARAGEGDGRTASFPRGGIARRRAWARG